MVPPVPTAEVLLISRHPHRSLDLRRLGLEVRQEDPAALRRAPVLGAAGIVIIDALDGDAAAADLLATVGQHVENAAVVVLLDEGTPPPDALGAQMKVLRSPIRGQDVATAISQLAQATVTAEPKAAGSAPLDSAPAPSSAVPTTETPPPGELPTPTAEPSHQASCRRRQQRRNHQASCCCRPSRRLRPAGARTAAADPTGTGVRTGGTTGTELAPAPAPARRVPPPRERLFGRRRHASEDEPPVEQARVQQAQPLDWSAHAAAILAALHARPSWKEVAQGVAEEAAQVLGPSAALLVREPDGTWPVAAGVDLRQIEFGFVVDDEHTLVGLGTKQHPVAVVPDTDVLRSERPGAPLASRRCLLVALVFPLPVLLVVGRSEGPFDQGDVKSGGRPGRALEVAAGVGTTTTRPGARTPAFRLSDALTDPCRPVAQESISTRRSLMAVMIACVRFVAPSLS